MYIPATLSLHNTVVIKILIKHTKIKLYNSTNRTKFITLNYNQKVIQILLQLERGEISYKRYRE